jgi:hypothetical protein
MPVNRVWFGVLGGMVLQDSVIISGQRMRRRQQMPQFSLQPARVAVSQRRHRRKQQDQ